MSAASDKFENDVAKNINKLPGIKAIRPKVSTEYSDVKIEIDKFKGDNAIWLEVKMSHTDNLSNPRVFYDNGKWQTTYKTPAAKHTVDILNRSAQAKAFIKAIAKFSGIPEKSIKIPTTKSGLKEPGAVPLKVMKDFFSQPGINRYIANEENYNLGDVVTEHYTIGKAKPAYYMQAGDDFYMVSKKNPLKIQGIPLLNGTGDFKVRVATRSEFYEVQAEIKIKKMPISKYSVAPATKKPNPFMNMKK
jgi:hypothetical protein